MTEKLPISNFKWVKNAFKIGEKFIKNYDEKDDIGYFLKVDIEYLQELHDLHIDYHSYQKKGKLMDTTSLCVRNMIKKK